jgi:hypothetical protein
VRLRFEAAWKPGAWISSSMLQARGHRHRIAAQRAGLVDRALGAIWRISSARPPYAPTGMPPADDLARRCSGPASRHKRLLRAAERDAEAGHHFVEDQSRAVARAQFARRCCRYPSRRRQAVGVADDGLDDQAAMSLPASSNSAGGGVEIVVGQRERRGRRVPSARRGGGARRK